MKKLTIGLFVLLVVVIVAVLIFTSLLNDKNNPLSPANRKSKITPTAAPPVGRTFVMYVKNWQFEPNVIRLRKGDQVTLQLKSLDVKHGFSLPAYDLNASLDPFKTVTLQFTATEQGTFDYICTLNCGPKGYTGMRGTLIVE